MAHKAVDIVGKKLDGENAIPYLVEVKLVGADQSTTFRRVRETLERIGVSSRTEEKTLHQSCHILHKRGRYYITHFKSLFALDGRDNNITVEDIARQNKIIDMIKGWNMVELVDPSMITEPMSDLKDIKVLKHDDRATWTIRAKYKLGQSRTEHKPTGIQIKA